MAYKGTMPEIVERHIVEIGDIEECDHCKDGDKFFSKAKPKGYKYKYRYVKDGTKTAEKLRKEFKIKSKYVPAIIDCKKMANGKEVCSKPVIGFNKKDWDL